MLPFIASLGQNCLKLAERNKQTFEKIQGTWREHFIQTTTLIFQVSVKNKDIINYKKQQETNI